MESAVDIVREYLIYDENGQLEEQYYSMNGRLYGEYKEWYHNGQLRNQGSYKNDKRNGEYKEWSNNGQLSIHIFYRNGNKICDLNEKILNTLINFQRSYRIRKNLQNYFNSHVFVEWWYSPTVKGGLLSKQDIANTILAM